ncbi:MAG TPA: 6-bladed beta-propeller [Desulfobacterales bacterium]|nr:6-bladed beta-propeller [Desulfobacterales bacterium]
MKSNRLKTAEPYPGISANHFCVYFLLLSILFFIFAGPAFGIRLVNVKHLFDITGKLNAPSDVAVSADGQIYVVDGVNNQIKVFDRNGKLVSSFGRQGSGNGEFRSPLGIDIDRAGNIYIADSGNHRLQIFNRWGNYSAQIKIPPNNKKPADPTDVAVDDSRNRCYIVDNDNHHILVYDLATFKLLNTYGSPGTDKRAFRYPFFITLNKEKYLYIVDVINTRVQVLNPEGLFVAFVGDWGVKKGEFFRPKGVAVDKQGRVFVSDSYMGVIQVFDSNGNFSAVVGDPAKNAVKKFQTPVGLFIDKEMRLYVVEMFANKVSVYSIEK